MSGDRRPGDGGPERVDLGERPSGLLEWFRWTIGTDHPTVAFAREVAASVLGVLLLGLVLFAVSGIWPPMVAVESGSMEPHMFQGDLVFVMEEHRLAPDYATGSTGIVTHRVAQERDAHWKFGDHGDVIVFDANGGGSTPVIHRARFWVDEGENWYGRADPAYVAAAECGESPDEALANCPAPHAGFVTLGDDNSRYDQAAGISSLVRPAWIKGTAELRVPWLGYVRLCFTELQRPGVQGTCWGGGSPVTIQRAAS